MADYFNNISRKNSILAVKKAGHLNIKTKMASEYSQRVLASQPIRVRVSKFFFMLLCPAFLTASIVPTVDVKHSMKL